MLAYTVRCVLLLLNTRAPTPTRTHAHAHAHTHTRTRTHAHTHTRTHRRTHALSPLSLSRLSPLSPLSLLSRLSLFLSKGLSPLSLSFSLSLSISLSLPLPLSPPLPLPPLSPPSLSISLPSHSLSLSLALSRTNNSAPDRRQAVTETYSLHNRVFHCAGNIRRRKLMHDLPQRGFILLHVRSDGHYADGLSLRRLRDHSCRRLTSSSGRPRQRSATIERHGGRKRAGKPLRSK